MKTANTQHMIDFFEKELLSLKNELSDAICPQLVADLKHSIKTNQETITSLKERV